VTHAFGPNQKTVVPLPDRFSLSPEEASALTGIGTTSIRAAASGDDLKAWGQALPRIDKNPNELN
jgi:hypothetical protein